jgi:hypothetical protein
MSIICSRDKNVTFLDYMITTKLSLWENSHEHSVATIHVTEEVHDSVNIVCFIVVNKEFWKWLQDVHTKWNPIPYIVYYYIGKQQ